MYDILAWIVFGLVAGFIAKAIMPGPDTNSTVITIILGIVGALVGGFLGQAFLGTSGGATSGPFNIMGLVLAVIGAIVVLAVYRLVAGRSLRA